MIKKIIYLSFLSIVLSRCSNKKSNLGNSTILNLDASKKENNAALKLFNKNCYSYHSVTSKSQYWINAPQIAAIKRSYRMSYPNEEEFILTFTR